MDALSFSQDNANMGYSDICNLESPVGPWVAIFKSRLYIRGRLSSCGLQYVSLAAGSFESLTPNWYSLSIQGDRVASLMKFLHRITVVLGKIDIAVQFSGPHENWTKFQKRSLTLNV